MKAVIFKLNAFGDNVVFVSAVQELRRRCPEMDITLITTPNEAELYGGPLAPQRILTSTKKAFNKSYRRPWVLASWVLRVRNLRPDACLLAFDQGSAAHVIASLSGARIRIGGNVAQRRISAPLTEDIALPEDGRPVTWNWRMARALARSSGQAAGWSDLAPAPDLRHLIKDEGEAGGTRRRVIVHAGASRTLNRWDKSRFARVAESLSSDCDVFWVIHGEATGTPPRGVTGVEVQSIGQLANLFARADLFVGNNSGPMHLANALGCKGVVVTGSSAAGWDPYWHRDRWSVLRHPNLYCAPCEKPNGPASACANLENPMACMEYWSSAMVEAACRSRLGLPVGPPR
jgi:ADP-heptose:LPS heptosyltransferase